jgi:hypothetical protein
MGNSERREEVVDSNHPGSAVTFALFAQQQTTNWVIVDAATRAYDGCLGVDVITN